MEPNHRLQATHKSALVFVFSLAVGAVLLCAPEPKRYVYIMNSEIAKIIQNQFSGRDRELVTEEMENISLVHVMAQSDENLKNTHAAILKLAKGSVKEVARLVECAKRDFRDVIYWASLE